MTIVIGCGAITSNTINASRPYMEATDGQSALTLLVLTLQCLAPRVAANQHEAV